MDINATMKQLAEYNRIADETNAIIESLKDEIKKYMKDNNTDTIIGTEHKATYKTIVSNRFNSADFKKEHSDLYNEYIKPVSSTRFTFN
jgi:predicted phage-related endonuclease